MLTPLAEGIPSKCDFGNPGGGSVRYTCLASNPDPVPYSSLVVIDAGNVSEGGIIAVDYLCEYKDTCDGLEEQSESVHNRTSAFSRTYLGT
jgi:hypothetical protein